MAFLKDFAVWPCEFCVLILGCVAGFRWPRIGVPEALGGSYVGVVWFLASGPVSSPLWFYNENFGL